MLASASIFKGLRRIDTNAKGVNPPNGGIEQVIKRKLCTSYPRAARL